jgi:outer membrane immunogenic protein
VAETTLPAVTRQISPIHGKRAHRVAIMVAMTPTTLALTNPPLGKSKMKKAFIAGIATAAIYGAPAIAADVPVKAPVNKAIAQVYDWTGWYVGYNVGLGVSQTNASTPNAVGDEGSNDVTRPGPAGGVQGGYNWHFSPNLVAGIEGDIGFLVIKRSVADFNDTVAFGVKTDAYGTLRGRLGYTSGPSLFYLTGGIAVVRFKNSFTEGSDDSSTSRTASGFTFGGGLETMLGGGWSAKVEYLNIDAGDVSVDGTPLGLGTAVFENRFHIFRYGANYRFGGPVSANVLPAHSWSGFYAGVNAGAGVSQVAVNAPPTISSVGSSVDIAASGFTGGAQAGYNWQAPANWLLGVEGDIGVLRVKRSFKNWDDPERFGINAGWYSTLRGRLAYSTGPALLYVTGGAALVSVRNDFDRISRSKTAVGWTAGGGIEAAFTHNWTAKAEYLYVDAGKIVFDPEFTSINEPAVFHNRFHVFRLGLNYKFGG